MSDCPYVVWCSTQPESRHLVRGHVCPNCGRDASEHEMQKCEDMPRGRAYLIDPAYLRSEALTA